MKENINDKLSDALTDVDDGYIVKTAKPPMKQRNLWIRFGAIAACLVLVLSAIPLWAVMRGREPGGTTESPDYTLPTYDDAHFSAQDIAGIFGSVGTNCGGTPYYGWHYVPDPSYLYLTEIPTGEYFPVYETTLLEMDEEIFQDFINEHLQSVCDVLGLKDRSYTISKWTDEYDAELGSNIHTYFVQYRESNNFHMSFNSTDDKLGFMKKLYLNKLMETQWESDEDIILSLSETRTALEKMFGRNFPDVKVLQRYDSSTEGASVLEVYFYDASESLNLRKVPDTDYVFLWFDLLYHNIEVQYTEYRYQMKLVSNEKVFPLEKAEELLREGYVFGRNGNKNAYEEVDFSDYDIVGFTYIFDDLGSDSDTEEPKSSTGIPFYVFYKQIGTTESGNLIYVSTYVPAIEVSGLKEYFEAQNN